MNMNDRSSIIILRPLTSIYYTLDLMAAALLWFSRLKLFAECLVSIEPSDSQTGNMKLQKPPLQSLFSIVFTTHYPSFLPQKKKNMLSKLLIAITTFVVAVNAQSPSSSAVPAIPSLTPCVTECITKAAALDDCVSLYVSWHIHSHLVINLINF